MVNWYIIMLFNRQKYLYLYLVPIPVAARPKAWVCGRWLAGIADLNPAEGMVVCLLSLLFVVM